MALGPAGLGLTDDSFFSFLSPHPVIAIAEQWPKKEKTHVEQKTRLSVVTSLR
jgi:hypothetical protein